MIYQSVLSVDILMNRLDYDSNSFFEMMTNPDSKTQMASMAHQVESNN